MALTTLALLGWAMLNTLLIALLALRAAQAGQATRRRISDLETRMTHLEATQREILHEVRAGRVALHALATQQQIVDAVDRAVESAFGKRLSPRRDPAATHFHGPTTVHGPLAGGNIGQVTDPNA